jgi:serine acetyltransferase
MLISSQINSRAKIGHPECIKHDLELVFGKKVFFVFQCCNLLKTVHKRFTSSQIDSTAKIGHPECIKHDLELV